MSNKRSHTPTYNMKVVVQETGLKPVTLRAWERRYGMPNPHRTEGGHRLYSQYEIDTLKWLLGRQNEGLSIKNAIDLWHQLKEQGNDPFEMDVSDMQASVKSSEITGTQLDQLRTAWIDACLAFDEYSAQNILAQAFALFPTNTVCFNILQKGLVTIGQGWYEGTISVQQEHFASALALRKLESLISSMLIPATREERIIIGCPPSEQHTFSPLLLTLLLRQNGWEVIYLGANVPIDRLETAVRTIQPKLVIMAAQTLHSAGNLVPLASLLHTLNVRMAFGGGVFNVIPETREYIPGYFLSEDLRDAVNRVETLINTPIIPNQTNHPIPSYQQALKNYQEKRAAIEADLYEKLTISTITQNELKNANNDLGNNLVAALTLGSIDLLAANIDWIQGLLINYHYRMPEKALGYYLQAYHDALQKHLDQRGDLILQWFDKLLSN